MTRMMRTLSAALVLVAFALGSGACASGTASGPTANANADMIELPSPVFSSEMTLEEASGSRRSVREYSDQPLATTEPGPLLWAVQGITSEHGFCTAPSAGALYPLEVCLLTARDMFHFMTRRFRKHLAFRQITNPFI